jgi:hypothetical protein
MKLILTEAEKKAAKWADLDNESLGKVVKATMFVLKKASDEQKQLWFISAAIMMCSAAVDANADTYKQTIEGLTIEGKSFGNWKVTIQRVDSK